jgi:hypothetical protein
MPSSKRNELIVNHHLVQALWDEVNQTSGGLANVAPLVKRLLESGGWREREVVQINEIVRFDSFVDFIRSPPLRGCGWPLEKVEVLIRDDPETLTMWRQATTGEKHLHKTDHDNVIITSKQGNSRAYTLTRLKRERPDLYARVKAGELSANAAAIEAGWRSNDALTKLRRAWKSASSDDRMTFLAEIDDPSS